MCGSDGRVGLFRKGMEVSAAPAPSPAVAVSPAAVASVPASDSSFTVSGPLTVEHQLDVLAQRDGVISPNCGRRRAPTFMPETCLRNSMTGN